MTDKPDDSKPRFRRPLADDPVIPDDLVKQPLIGDSPPPPTDPVFADPTSEELAMIADEMHQLEQGRPLPRKVAEGITVLQARIAFLTEQKRKLLGTMAESSTREESWQAAMLHAIDETNRELSEAEQRLVTFQAEFKTGRSRQN